jgi:hypothetical protein
MAKHPIHEFPACIDGYATTRADRTGARVSGFILSADSTGLSTTFASFILTSHVPFHARFSASSDYARTDIYTRSNARSRDDAIFRQTYGTHAAFIRVPAYVSSCSYAYDWTAGNQSDDDTSHDYP